MDGSIENRNALLHSQDSCYIGDSIGASHGDTMWNVFSNEFLIVPRYKVYILLQIVRACHDIFHGGSSCVDS